MLNASGLPLPYANYDRILEKVVTSLEKIGIVYYPEIGIRSDETLHTLE